MPKLSVVTAHATGAAIRNPERYSDAVDLTTIPLGPPSPEIIEEGLLNQWNFYRACISWATEADRRLIEKACLYRANSWKLARYRLPIIDDKSKLVPTDRALAEDAWLYELDHKAEGIELRILEKLGCTPTSRPKVTPPGHKGGQIARKKQWW